MKAKLLKIAALILGLATLIYIVRIHAQTVTGQSASVTTNWVGCLVVGKDEPIDRLARGPFPTSLDRVEIGLRSDGIVVWRNAGNAK